MKVSVIIPVYNEEKYIPECLESLFSQTYKEAEVLVADDGSTDKTASIIKKYPVKLYQRPHLGVSEQCNFLAKKARGKILIKLDADMYYDKNYIKKIIGPILRGKTIATFSREEYVANPENVWSKCWSINSGLPIDKRIPENELDEAWTFRAILKKVFLNVGGYDNTLGYGEDDRSLLVKLGRPAAIPAPGAISYHYNPSSLSEVFFSSRFIGRGEIYRKRIIRGLLIHSFLNSVRAGIYGSLKHKIPRYLFFR